MYDEILSIMKSVDHAEASKSNISPTKVYNEGWMLRLVLRWLSNNREINYKFKFLQDSTWYSEALLSTKFKPKHRGDKLSELWTHADGVVGNFAIGKNGFGDLKLKENFKQFIVFEAKMFSKYSKGTKNAPSYNQAARIVACMCNTIKESLQSPQKIDTILHDNLSGNIKIAFYTVLPSEQIKNEPSFEENIKIENIVKVVKSRIDLYKDREDYQDYISWFYNIFMPLSKIIKTELVSWEEIIDFIQIQDYHYGNNLRTFYNKCLDYNNKYNKKGKNE